MNILVDTLPSFVNIDGEKYALKTDFRSAISTILAFEDDELSNGEKVEVMLRNTYADIPENLEQAVLKCQWFLNGGNDDEPARSKRLYSFGKDANMIFAAFRQTHGIDLQTEKMHWWKFLSLFMDLGKDTTFISLVSLRDRHNKGKTTKEEKMAIANMGDAFHVPDTSIRSLEEKEFEQDFIKRYKEAKAKRDKK